MSTSFDKKDDSVVVVIGTGPGGGVVASELAQKGVKVVALEAGGRHGPEDFVNDEWGSFVQISWLDSRSTSGSWRVADDFSGLPTWLVKGVGGSSQHWAGASLRFQEHEWKALTTYGNVTGASLLDWPIDAKTMDPYYTKLKINCASPEQVIGKGCLETTILKFLKQVQESLVIKMYTLAAWRLTHETMMTLLLVNKQVSVFKVVSGALNGLLVTMKFQLVKQLEIWKSGQTRRHLKLSMINPVKSRVLFTQIRMANNTCKKRGLFVLPATQ